MNNYVWNTEWENTDESYFSLMLKFLYANGITGSQLKRALNNQLKQFFLIKMGIYDKLIEEFISERSSYEYIKLCQKCINQAFHSNCHQITDYCYIHGEQLFSSCNNCNRQFAYNRLATIYNFTPYYCKCGHPIITNSQDNLLFQWSANKLPNSTVGLKLSLVCENGTLFEKKFLVSRDTESVIFETTIAGIYKFFSLYDNLKFTSRRVGFDQLNINDNTNPINETCLGGYVIQFILAIIKQQLLKKNIRQITLAILDEDFSDDTVLRPPVKYILWYI